MTEPTPREPATHYRTNGLPKIGYPDRKVAKLKARQIKRSGGGDRYPYACGECTGWHLSSTPRRSWS